MRDTWVVLVEPEDLVEGVGDGRFSVSRELTRTLHPPSLAPLGNANVYHVSKNACPLPLHHHSISMMNL